MMYNDYQILSNDQYSFLNLQYQNEQAFVRKDIILNICNELNLCKVLCLGLKNNYNKQVSNSIKSTFNLLDKNLNNLSSICKSNTIQTNVIKQCTIFELFKKLTTISSFLLNWISHESKEYYKTLAINTAKDINSTLTEISTALISSHVQLFKHM